MSRRSLVWLLTVPLAVIGSQLGHALAYALATPNHAERAHELSASGHDYLAYLPIALAICIVLVAVALVGELRHLVRVGHGSSSSLSPWKFAVLVPAIFVTQEHLERLLHDGALPWSVSLEPTFIIGLLVQLPLALVAFLFAHTLLRAVHGLGRLLVRRARRQFASGGPGRPAIFFVPRVPVLALGYGSRGPPTHLH